MKLGNDRSAEQEEIERARLVMIDRHLRRRGLRDARILSAMRKVPRDRFVPAALRASAYADCPLPIGEGQTISQPYIVALMTEALDLTGTERILEIGTGSGYQTAILAEIGAEVWSIERSAALHRTAVETLTLLGYTSVHCLLGDGTLGHPSGAPFDRIIATGSLPDLPTTLFDQLVEGGIFVGPVGSFHIQRLIRVVYHRSGFECSDLGGCRFVPLIGAKGWEEPPGNASGRTNERRTP